VAAELFEVESHREVRTFGGDHEDANVLVRGDRRCREREVVPKGVAESVSHVGTIQPERRYVFFDVEGDDGRRKLHVFLSIDCLAYVVAPVHCLGLLSI
jgi:hypothetical protein